MKKFSKILSVALLVALVLSLGVASAFADEPAVPTSQTIATDSAPDTETGEYTISVKTDDTHTYTVYQILTGTLIPGESKLGNPVWGQDAKGETGTNTGVNDFINDITATGLSNTEINDLVGAQLKENAEGVGTVTAAAPLNVAPGYYLLVDTTADLKDGESLSLNIVAVFNDITIAPKKGTTTSEKHVDDQNDSDATDHSELKDSADYDIGDTIPYTLTMTLPEDYANYKEYYVKFYDEMSKGLTYNGDAKIYFGAGDTTGTTITFGSTAITEGEYKDGTAYTYTIANLKTEDYKDYNLAAGSVITIKYTATLNDNAVVGNAGNPNRYKVEFSNNPNHEGDGTPTNDTPWDINIVFTYKTVFNKVDGEQKPLTGADFTLYKKVVDNSEAGFSWVDVTTLHTGDGAKNPSKTKDNVTDGDKTVANAKFTFSGLDAGDYKLSETATPTGYNTIADIEFTITATHQLESDNPQLTALTGTDGAEFTMTPSVSDGSLSADIKNLQGSVLPSTGGIGTTIFYVVGGVLVLAAIILLVTKKRMSE